MKLEIDVTDWHEATMRDEILVETDQDVIELADNTTTAKIAKAAIISRAIGKAEPEKFTLRADKVNLLFGTMQNIGQIIKTERRETRTKDGMTDTPVYIGKPGARPGVDNTPVQVDGDEPETDNYVKVGSVTAGARARFYLTRNIPTEIRNMLFILRDSGGDYAQAAETLKSSIDAMVQELTVPPTVEGV